MTAAAPARVPVHAPRYHPVQRAIHWLVALAVLALVPIGLLIDGYKQENVDAVNAALGPGGFNLIYDLHKSLGLTVLGLMILRVVARAVWREPPWRVPHPRIARLAAGAVHLALYALLLVVPVIGWLGVSAYPAPAPFWFLFDAALPVAPDRAVSESLLSAHGSLAILLALLACAHVLAALKHRLIDRDETLGRMAP